MLAGRVVGHVWSAKKIDQLPAGALLEVKLTSGPKETIIAFDPLGCGIDENVLITTGSVASHYFMGADTVVDALVIASLEETNSKAKT